MDETRFDSLTKAFVSGSRSRRSIIAGAIAGTIAGAVSLVDAEAMKKKKKKKCKKPKVKCGKKCCDPIPTTCVEDVDCGANCRCWFTVESVEDLACYDESSGTTCCDASSECGPNAGCIAGACNEAGPAGRCFSRCDS